ncbi:MAG: aminotransferase [Rhodospirillaceae bacterium]|jgi:aspartate/methionine/tyrosine aminotransferase|nr:aminotransferase [Rhodospirillaceae bacterium]MBT5079399.1 aminotransferase [Rhodospirillaceae bacterium]MBT5525874.1 aminotransferase [Rhodospirillaceae bacterium]MBT5880246.1 aminotransferase [Rhodospirillaceae bacterium]MBT6588609.1 aminotransferase [Rhodospirillaceae bacterium]
MKPANSVLASFGTTVFEVMTRLAIEHQTINLGQGFPDEDGPDSIKAMVDTATKEGPNQYPPMMGIPELRQAIATHNKRFHGLDVDWQTETMVTTGATEGLAASILALIEPGDEAIVFEPLYDSYVPMLRRAGADVKLVRLSPPNWDLPKEELVAAFSERTKLILLNTPMNPTGKVFNEAELSFIADLVLKYDTYAICDEVYEHLIFDGAKHHPLMLLPGMRERTIRIGSAGKTFSMTSWKVGFLTAAPELLALIAKAHQFLVFTTPSNLQRAVAHGLHHEQDWYTNLSVGLQAKRDMLQSALTEIGFDVMPCDATYFMNADYRPLGFKGTDVDFCRHVTIEAGVTILPVSALYATPDVDHLVRFCFCKKDAVLEGALDRLRDFFRT